MVRYTRVTASLIRSLLLGTAVTAVTFSTASVLVGCADENQPEYWIDKLDEKPWRARSIKRLGQFFEDAMTRADRDITKPEVKTLLDKLAEPLTKIYTEDYQALDEKTRENLINLVASFRDARTEPALKKAFEEFGKRGRGGKDVKWASRAVRDMKLKTAAPDVFAAFKKTKPSTKEGAYYRDLNEALLVVADKSWNSELVALLEQDWPNIKKKGKKPSPDLVKDYRDKAYHSITAAQILGELQDPGAVKPLMKVILDPTKGDAANEALLALTKIGKPAVDAAAKLLNNQDKELAEYHKKRIQKAQELKSLPKGNLHVSKAAAILGAIGRSEAVPPMLKAISKAKNDTDKVMLMSSLAMLPHTKEVKNAFVKNLSALDKDASANRQNATQALSEPATLFFDSSLVNLLLERGDLKDDKVAQSMIALAAIKLMNASQTRKVGRFVKALPKGEGALAKHMEKVKNGYKIANEVVTSCKKDIACYIKAAEKNQSDKNQLAGVKALYMVGMLGGAETADKLLEAMPGLEKGSLRYVASQVIDHHHPKGSKALADKIEKIVDKNKKSMDKGKAAGDKPLRDAMYRLRARAQ